MPRRTAVAFFCTSLVALTVPAGRAQTRTSAAPAAVVELVPGSPVRRDLREGESHRYRAVLDADRRVEIRVEQDGVRPLVTISGADDVDVLKRRAAPRRRDEASLTFITTTAGEY